MSIFLSNSVIVLFFVESIVLALLTYSFVIAVNIIRSWNYTNSTSYQYKLEKDSYLATTIIFFVVFVQVVVFVYFVVVLDDLSNTLPGAMCAAGVVSANIYGNILLLGKLVLLFGFGVWIVINRLDIQDETYPYLLKKYYWFVGLYLLYVALFVVQILYFVNISIQEPVLCCSAVFATNDSLSFLKDHTVLLFLFYINYMVLMLANIFKKPLWSFVGGVLFLFVSYFVVVYFFGTYIYELPTHHCPFCMLQKEYSFVGFVLWIALFLTTYFSILPFIVQTFIKKRYNNTYKIAVGFGTLFVLLCSYFVVVYYIRNGVFL
jgi:hypothetical protein